MVHNQVGYRVTVSQLAQSKHLSGADVLNVFDAAAVCIGSNCGPSMANNMGTRADVC